MFKGHSKPIWISIIVIIVGITAVISIYHYTHRPPVIKPTPVNTSTGNTSKSGATTTTPVQTQSNSSNKSSDNQGSSPQATLVAPSGSFVSNHKPNLSGSPAPNTEESTCEVPQSVSCDITFTNSSTGKTLSLGSQTAGSNGLVAWHWSLQGVGLTQGSWTVKAIATLGSQTKTTTDPIALDVQP